MRQHHRNRWKLVSSAELSRCEAQMRFSGPVELLLNFESFRPKVPIVKDLRWQIKRQLGHNMQESSQPY
jgi:hypothetical protein